MISAQKLALASAAGQLSLVLRKAGDSADEASRRITLIDIGAHSGGTPAIASGVTTIRVIRAAKNEEYSVPVEGIDRLQASGARRGVARP